MITPQKNCSCKSNTATKLLFSCSGAADVGGLADQAARQLNREGVGKMYCLSGIGGQVSSVLKTTQNAASILAIDGCPLDCAKKSLEEAGFTTFNHLRLSDMGMEKGKTVINDETIAQVINKAKTFL